MISLHYHIRCNHPACLEEFVGPPLPLYEPPSTGRTLGQARRAQWARVKHPGGIEEHWCPIHAPVEQAGNEEDTPSCVVL